MMEFRKSPRRRKSDETADAFRTTFLAERLPDGRTVNIRRFPMGTIKTVVDVGAHIGMFSLLARFLHPEARIIAVEPHPDNYATLARNVAGLDIETVERAIGPPGAMWLHPGRRTDMHRYQEDRSGGGSVESVSLPGLFRELKIGAEGVYIKIDIEGAEVHFLKDLETIDLFRGSVGMDFDLHKRTTFSIPDFRKWIKRCFRKTHLIGFSRSRSRGWGVRYVTLARRGVPQINPLSPIQKQERKIQ